MSLASKQDRFVSGSSFLVVLRFEKRRSFA
jgi:hypothetical protein